MNFIDKWKEELEDEELLDVEDDEEVYEISFDEFLEKMSPNVREKIALERVKLFATMDKALQEQGYDDWNERLRIMEIIY